LHVIISPQISAEHAFCYLKEEMNREKGDLNMDLKDKVILITGASSGIGKAVALALSHAREL